MSDRLGDVTLLTPYQRLALFGASLPQERRRILAAVCRNNARMAGLSTFTAPLRQSPYGSAPGAPNASNWRSSILDWVEYLNTIPGSNPLQRLELLNQYLASQGLCPLTCYAFDQWWSVDRYLDELIDLSTTYAYRLVPLPSSYRTGDLVGTGAYCDVWLCAGGQAIEKVARNLAAKAVAIPQEVVVSRQVAQTPLAAHVPELLSFERSGESLCRRRVVGPAGVDLLKQNVELPNQANLRAIYEICDRLYRNAGLNLDIHPGNFRWDLSDSAWKLVDLGPMPSIGANYFPRNDFPTYLKKIWFDLPRLMREVPIRSLDLSESPHTTEERTEMPIFANQKHV